MTYDMYTSDLLAAMKKLVSRADIITPNLTEFCLLTDTDYKAFQNTSLNMEDIITKIQTASLALTEKPPKENHHYRYPLYRRNRYT